MALVSIGSGQKGQRPLRTQAAKTADKLFSFGMIVGLVGSIAVGAYLWLGLNQQVALSPAYLSLRSLHASLQLHYFMGAFIVGFLLQAAPRVLESESRVDARSRFVFPLLVVAMLTQTLVNETGGRILASFSFLAAFCFLLPVIRTTARDNFIRMAVPCALSLLTLSVSALIDASRSDIALSVFWWGIVSVIMGVGQQFIGNILGGRKLERGAALVVSIGFVVTGLLFMLDAFISGETFYRWEGIAALATFAVYGVQTRLFAGVARKDAFSRAFVVSWVWGFTGAVLLLTPWADADSALHLWATGLAVTMTIAVSSRVVGHVAGRAVFPEPIFYGVIALWQLVPIGRGLRWIVPHSFAWIVGVAAAVVFIAWIVQVARAIVYLVRKLRAEKAAAYTGVGANATT